MGYKELEIKMPTGYSQEQLEQGIRSKLNVGRFSFQVIQKSLDARKKSNIVWQMRVVVSSNEIRGGEKAETGPLQPEYEKRNKKIVVIGCGPAGFYAAYFLQKSGFETLIIERGSDVGTRAHGIADFEKNGNFHPRQNYAFGEGGAGTFSDGKLTSRSKHISKERQFIISSYIGAGAPEEIAYLTYPHIGSDNLKRVVRHLRQEYIENGGRILFDTMLQDLVLKNDRVKEVITEKGYFEADYCVLAIGHSAHDTYKMLMLKGIPFRTKNFAIGSRAEHLQQTINLAQWGLPALNGVKAAEYRLTSDGDGKHQAYTFCMCPGGIVVPAMAYENTSVVNGMSYYQRNGNFANAACVAGIHPDDLAGKTVSPEDALNHLDALEQSFFKKAGGYQAPFCTINDFLKEKLKTLKAESSYPLGIVAMPLWQMLPPNVVSAMQAGIKSFSAKLKGYENGLLLGLESKTSSPVQVVREKNGQCTGFSNLFMIGEGSGYTGGIVSSAADGIKSGTGHFGN
jgi:uncharacterized protein